MSVSPGVLTGLLAGSVLLMGCIRPAGDSERRRLLTGHWFSGFSAWDLNANGLLDTAEMEQRHGLEYDFRVDGNGEAYAGPGSVHTPFTWVLLRGDLDIAFGTDTNRIHTLDAAQFILEGHAQGAVFWLGFRH